MCTMTKLLPSINSRRPSPYDNEIRSPQEAPRQSRKEKGPAEAQSRGPSRCPKRPKLLEVRTLEYAGELSGGLRSAQKRRLQNRRFLAGSGGARNRLQLRYHQPRLHARTSSKR